MPTLTRSWTRLAAAVSLAASGGPARAADFSPAAAWLGSSEPARQSPAAESDDGSARREAQRQRDDAVRRLVRRSAVPGLESTLETLVPPAETFLEGDREEGPSGDPGHLVRFRGQDDMRAFEASLKRAETDFDRVTNSGNRRNAYASRELGRRRLLAARFGSLPRMDGIWFAGPGASFQVNVLGAPATSRATALGMHYDDPRRPMLNRGEVLPRELWGSYPLFEKGQLVRCELIVRNDSGRTLHDVTVWTAQEPLSRRGAARTPFAGRAQELTLGTMRPSEVRKVPFAFPLSVDWRRGGSLEQTHVRVGGRLALAGGLSLLAESVRAAAVDPPPSDAELAGLRSQDLSWLALP